MKLGKRNLVMVSFMLFSLFFGAGNLIFPPFLGQSAGTSGWLSLIGFMITAVLLPVLGVIVVSRFDGLDRLGKLVGERFGIVFTVLIYLSIGPGLGIPRAASVPFEMAVAPYLPEGSNTSLWLALYSAVFFSLSLWLCLNPKKLVNRIGHILTPTLLLLLVTLFVGFLIRGQVSFSAGCEEYRDNPFLKGFTEGYHTMDAIAALNFGIVIASSLRSFGIEEKKEIEKYTVSAGLFAGTILAAVYAMLTYVGMCSSGVYDLPENGAQTLRAVVYQVFGNTGTVLLAAIFTLACLTTCIGLIHSISQYFSTLFKRFSYRQWVYLMTAFSFLVCNMGLSTILSLSVPLLQAIYPVSIVLIVLGLTHKAWKNHTFVYPLVVWGTALISVIYALDSAGVPAMLAKYLPLYSDGYGWLVVAALMLAVGCLLPKSRVKKQSVDLPPPTVTATGKREEAEK